MASYQDYADAAALLWDTAGQYAADQFSRLNHDYFDDTIPPMPIIIAMIPYGVCLAWTARRPGWLTDLPRITLPPELFNGSDRVRGGERRVTDVLLHEMAHASLMLAGHDSRHNARPWCDLITRLTRQLLGKEILAAPVTPRRLPNPDRDTTPEAPRTKVARVPLPGYLTQKELGCWPQTLRPAGYYKGGRRLHVPAA